LIFENQKIKNNNRKLQSKTTTKVNNNNKNNQTDGKVQKVITVLNLLL